MSQQLTVNANLLTLGEVEDIEDIVGKPAAQIFTPDGMSARAITAIVWVLGRRDNPTFTLDEARATPVGELHIVGVGEVDPTVAAG